MRHAGLLLNDKIEACEACGARPLGEIDWDPLWVSEDVPVISDLIEPPIQTAVKIPEKYAKLAHSLTVSCYRDSRVLKRLF